MVKLKDPLRSKFTLGPSTIMLFLTLLCPIAAEWIRRSNPEETPEALVLLFNVFPIYFAPVTLLLSALYFLRYRRLQYAIEFVFLSACILWLYVGSS
ncbi:MAG: hypothetical protein GY906_21200 [bacterium]|nr:hypothetical protein [bacterium]